MDPITSIVTKIVFICIAGFIILYFLFRLFGGGQLFSNEQVANFTAETNSKITNTLGQSVEGFEPAMFLRVYPGLLESDFHQVESHVGRYVYEDGKLLYDQDGKKELHTISGVISEKGMHRLLQNIGVRLGISRTDPDLVQKVIRGIENTGGIVPIVNGQNIAPEIGQLVVMTGIIQCLGRKNTSESQTLECVLGFHTEDGTCYGIQNLYEINGVPLDQGQEMRVTGILHTPHSSNIYEIEGVIDVQSAVEI